MRDLELLSGDEARYRFPYLSHDIVQARFRAGDHTGLDHGPEVEVDGVHVGMASGVMAEAAILIAASRGPSAGTDQVKRVEEKLDRSKREAERLKEVEGERELERQQILDYLAARVIR